MAILDITDKTEYIVLYKTMVPRSKSKIDKEISVERDMRALAATWEVTCPTTQRCLPRLQQKVTTWIKYPYYYNFVSWYYFVDNNLFSELILSNNRLIGTSCILRRNLILVWVATLPVSIKKNYQMMHSKCKTSPKKQDDFIRIKEKECWIVRFYEYSYMAVNA